MAAFACEEVVLRARIAEGRPLAATKLEVTPTTANAKTTLFPPLSSSPIPAQTLFCGASPSQTEVELCARFHGAVNCRNTATVTATAQPSTMATAVVDCAPSTSALQLDEQDDDDSTALQNSSSSNLRYERKSPTRSIGCGSATNYFDVLPWHVMYTVFDNFEIRDRIRASMVCKRWHSLLTDGRFPLEDVAVMNVFERDVWENSLSNNTGSKFQCSQFNAFKQFESAMAHCTVATSVKIWYFTTRFARAVLEILRRCNVKMRCLDVYPYSQHIGMEHFYACLPDVRGLTMRPHGHDYFFKGLDLDLFPDFGQLETLNLDCINLGADARLPSTLTTLEWQSRNDDEFRRFLPKLSSLTQLHFLLLGHANFYDTDFGDFLQLISRMPTLQYLIFKFVKIDNLSYPSALVPIAKGHSPLHRLQFLKFDLCYGNLTQMLNVFLQLTSINLRIISLNLLSDECTETANAFHAGLFDFMARQLHERQITLHLGFLQRDNDNVVASERLRKQIAAAAATTSVGANAGDCTCAGGHCDSCKSIKKHFPSVSRYFERVLGKFEASFVSDNTLLRGIFGAHRFPVLTELKFIQCEALTDDLLGCIATCCTQLRKLSILSCTKCDETGVRHFVEHFQLRDSQTLKIVWKRDRYKFMRPSNFFLNLINEYKHLLAGLKYRFMCKTFGEGNGEAIIIWHDKKKLFIQDFDEFDRNRILGFILPNSHDTLSPAL